MESSGRNGDDAERPASDGPDHVRLPLERSAEGRFVVRSSSHPPNDQTSGVDVSGVHSRPQSTSKAPEATAPVARAPGAPERSRPGRSTPAERPRKRKELLQGSTYLADVRARCDTPRALPGSRISDRPSRAPWMGDGGSANPRSLSSLAALSAASAGGIGGVGSEERESGDEVTRRVRRPSSIPPVAHTQAPALSVSVSPWRGVLAAGAVVVLFLVALWLFG